VDHLGEGIRALIEATAQPLSLTEVCGAQRGGSAYVGVERLKEGRRFRAVALLVAAVAVVMVTSLFATRGDEGGSIRQSSRTTVAPDWERQVVDSRGAVRGVLSGGLVDLPGGFVGTAIRDRNGTLAGYFVRGQIGFVDAETAKDGLFMQQLEACYEQYSSTLRADDTCTAVLASHGVDTTPGD
jgi:hypothetical protein